MQIRTLPSPCSTAIFLRLTLRSQAQPIRDSGDASQASSTTSSFTLEDFFELEDVYYAGTVAATSAVVLSKKATDHQVSRKAYGVPSHDASTCIAPLKVHGIASRMRQASRFRQKLFHQRPPIRQNLHSFLIKVRLHPIT